MKTPILVSLFTGLCLLVNGGNLVAQQGNGPANPSDPPPFETQQPTTVEPIDSAEVEVDITIPPEINWPEGAIPLRELMRLGMSKSLLLTAEEQRNLAYQLQRRQSIVFPNPEVAVIAGQTTSKMNTQAGTFGTITVAQPIIFPGKRGAAKEMFEAYRAQENLSREQLRNRIAFAIARASYDYAVQLERLRHVDERLARIRTMRTFMYSRPFASPQKKAERVIVEERVRQIEEYLTRLKVERERAWAELNSYVAIAEQRPLRVKWFIKPINIDDKAVYGRSIDTHPDVRAKRLAVRAGQKELEYAEMLAYPDFAIVGTYQSEPAGPRQEFYGAGVSIPIPLSNRNQMGIESKKAALRSHLAELEFIESRVEREVYTYLEDYRSRSRGVEIFPLALEKKIDRDLDGADAGFRKGQVDLITYLELEKQSHEIHDAIYLSQLNYITSYLNLLYLQGNDIAAEERIYAE